MRTNPIKKAILITHKLIIWNLRKNVDWELICKNMEIITPGIRMINDNKNDQNKNADNNNDDNNNHNNTLKLSLIHI